MKLAQNLQMYRRRMSFSQEQLAEKCVVSRQAVAKWESGSSVPSIDMLLFLADLYTVSLDELVGRKDDPAIFKGFLARYVTLDAEFTESDDFTAVANRFIHFMSDHGMSSEDTVAGLLEIFCRGAE